MGGGHCVDCTVDSECSKNTSGCNVGVCQNNSCTTKPVDELTACTMAGVAGHCLDNVCTPTKSATVQDTDIGDGDAQVSYTSAWMTTGDIHYVTGEDATQCFSIRFTGTKIEVRGGKNVDRGIASYSLCDATGLGCRPLPSVDQYASTLLDNQQLVVQSGLAFGRYLIRGCATHTKNSASSGYIVDFDQANIN